MIEDKLERKLYEGMGEITSGFQPEFGGNTVLFDLTKGSFEMGLRL